METLKVLSLFSGIGAFEKALTHLGIPHEVVHYCEIDKYAAQSYAAVHNVDPALNLGDITKVDETKLPPFDLMTYGFPCQDISSAGRMKGIVKGETRSGLLYDALRIAAYNKPKYMIAENVKNLVGSRFKADFEKLLEELDSMGYNNYWKVLNAKDFGIPQSRERVFIVSVRKDVDQGYEFPKGVPLTSCASDYIQEDYDLATQEQIKAIEISTYQSRKFHNGKRWAPTLAARDWKDSGKYFIHEGKHVRTRAVAHWRLTGFTDEDFQKARQSLNETFYNGRDQSKTQLFKQAGNSIVVQVLEGILGPLLKGQY